MRERAAVRRYTAAYEAYEARILEEYDQLDKAGKGALMLREGLVWTSGPGGIRAGSYGAGQRLRRGARTQVNVPPLCPLRALILRGGGSAAGQRRIGRTSRPVGRVLSFACVKGRPSI